MNRILRTTFVLLLTLGTTTFAGPSDGGGKVFLTQEEALALAFPKCDVERVTFYLTKQQRSQATKAAGFDVGASIVHAYVARRDEKLVGTAWMDVSKVRTKKQVLMLVVAPDHRIARIELLVFAEPLDYVPRGNWYAQFVGKRLDKELSLKKSIKGITGATLTARATTKTARRLLALHGVVFPVTTTKETDQ